MGGGEEKGEVSMMDTDTSVSSTVEGAHDLKSNEYQYLAHMLRESQDKVHKLQEEARKQVRANMLESDKQRELCKKLHYSEQQMNKLKAENYSLQLKMEEMKNAAENKSSIKKEAKKRRIVEQIKFPDKK